MSDRPLLKAILDHQRVLIQEVQSLRGQLTGLKSGADLRKLRQDAAAERASRSRKGVAYLEGLERKGIIALSGKRRRP